MKSKLLFISILIIAFSILSAQFVSFLPFELAIKNINSDNAIFSLMAQSIIETKKIPIFFWGQNYMGPLTSILIAIIHKILITSNIINIPLLYQNIKILPQAPIIASFILIYLGHIFYYLASKFFLNQYKSLLFLLSLIVSHSIMTDAILRPLGQEMGYFFSGLCLYLGLSLIKKSTNLKLLLSGIIFGFGWWMNQNVIFVLLPLFVYYFFSHEVLYRYTYSEFDLKNRFSGKRHHLKSLLYLNLLLTIPCFIGILILIPGSVNIYISQLHFKATNGLDYIKLPIKLFLIIQFIFDWINFEHFRLLLKNEFKKCLHLIIGFLLGFSPVIFGKIFNWYPKAYQVELKLVPILNIPNYWWRLLTDYYPHVFFKFTPYLIFLLIFIMYKNFPRIKMRIYNLLSFDKSKIDDLIYLLPIIFIIFSLLVDRMRTEYTPRYAITFIPTVLLFIIYYLENLKWPSYIFLVAFIINNLMYLNEAYLFNFNSISNDKEITYLLTTNKNHCYADYWDVYRLNYLTGGKIDFLPYNSQDRTIAKTQNYLKNHQVNCIYDLNKKEIIDI